MPFHKSCSIDRTGVQQMAEGWGKIVARRGTKKGTLLNVIDKSEVQNNQRFRTAQ